MDKNPYQSPQQNEKRAVAAQLMPSPLLAGLIGVSIAVLCEGLDIAINRMRYGYSEKLGLAYEITGDILFVGFFGLMGFFAGVMVAMLFATARRSRVA